MTTEDAARLRFKIGEGLGTDGLCSLFTGVRVISSPLVREWEVYRFGPRMAEADLVVGPLTFWYLTHDFKLPMVSMFSRGMRELERDRRKHR